jgi:hypothetical protein
MNTYWKVVQMDCAPQSAQGSNYVTTVHWRCFAEDGAVSESVYGAQNLPESTNQAFVPYPQLTEQVVLGWIWANGVDRIATESAAAAKVDLIKNPPSVSPPVPWAP